MRCLKCDYIVPIDSEFCPYCGEPLNKTEELTAEPVIAESVAEASTEEISAQEEQTNTPQPAEQNAQGKRFCKLCGGELNDDKICTKCGHKYFKLRSEGKQAILICLIAALILSNIIFISLYATCNRNYRVLENDYEIMENRYVNAHAWVEDHKEEYNFYHNRAVIVSRGVTNYHSYDCNRINWNYFWIYNIEAAQGKGYDPCPLCCK